MASGYDMDRVNKISQIMPQFAKVAQPGDTVLMGLQGDPSYPFGAERPTAKITSLTDRNDDTLVGLEFADGSRAEYSTLSLAGDQVWEFDDASFQQVLNRQAANVAEARAESEPEYRGTEDMNLVEQLMMEVQGLKQELHAERENNKNFHNTMIASMNELANDILKVDSDSNRAEFCRVLTDEYSKLMVSRAEDSVYRGTEDDEEDDDDDDEEDEDEDDDEDDADEDEEEFSADETDFF